MRSTYLLDGDRQSVFPSGWWVIVDRQSFTQIKRLKKQAWSRRDAECWRAGYEAGRS